MSTLWTPGGEIPVDRNAPAEPTPTPTPDAGNQASRDQTPGDQISDDQLDQMRRQLLEAPAADVIAQHLMAFYELAAMHLSSDEPRLPDAKLAIDAIEAVLTGLAGRLGPAEEAIGGAVPQLKMAFVEASDRVAD
ncbi:MAG: hypothetical protein OSA99_08690 [Acidimicrobiales bacterium]|nr:hypothetical protein [Acidimicrobiales bacterium]